MITTNINHTILVLLSFEYLLPVYKVQVACLLSTCKSLVTPDAGEFIGTCLQRTKLGHASNLINTISSTSVRKIIH